MANSNLFFFPPFRLDVENRVLWHEARIVPLRPKTFTVLRYLVEHAGQLVTRAELSDAVWSATKVTSQVLRASFWELRHALGDTAKQPKFIETVSRQGWRFIAPLSFTSQITSPKSQVQSQTFPLAPNPQHLAPTLVGRETELTQLHGWLAKALQGERQLVFVTGEAGIGKTALIDAFLAQLGVRGWRSEKAKDRRQKFPTLNPNPQHPFFGSPTGSASSITARGSPICQC